MVDNLWSQCTIVEKHGKLQGTVRTPTRDTQLLSRNLNRKIKKPQESYDRQTTEQRFYVEILEEDKKPDGFPTSWVTFAISTEYMSTRTPKV